MRSRQALGLAITLGIGGCSSAPLAEDFEDPAATSVDMAPIVGGTLASAYPEAVYLNIDVDASGSGWACSGALIAPQVVLTAGHCVDAHHKWEVHVAGAYRVSTRGTTYDWSENGADKVNPNHHDIGLVFLESPVSLASYPTLAQAAIADKTQVTNIGRVRDGVVTSDLYRGTSIVSNAKSIGYPFDYYSKALTEHGDSGGPVMLGDSHTIVAVNSGGGTDLQVLARVDLLASWIAGQMASVSGVRDAGTGVREGGATEREGGVIAPDSGSKDGASGSKTVDAGASGTAPEAGAKEAGSAGAPAVCPAETEPNDDPARGMPLGDSVCGTLASASDVDWYVWRVKPGASTISLQGGDARFSIGMPAQGTCVTAFDSLSQVRVNVTGRDVSLCLRVSSPKGTPQAYKLLRAN